MSVAQKIWDAIPTVHDQPSFLCNLLYGALGWPVASTVEDSSYGWTAEELNALGLTQKVAESGIWQIQPFTGSQKWGIFLLEFKNPDVFTKGRGITTPLRSLLRALVPKKRASARPADRRGWDRENLLFICTHDYHHFRFAYFKAPTEGTRTAPLATFGWSEGDTHIRTLCEWNLSALALPEDEGADPDAWLAAWREAFDVEAVTRRFFEEYRAVFEHVEGQVRGVPTGEPRRLYTQRLFNRLMFLYFIQKKGWLSYKGDRCYLRALFTDAEAKGHDFLNDRLYSAFFHGLNVPRDSLKPKDLELVRETCGDVPYLNGGLFEALEDQFDVRGAVTIPNEAFARILGLFERYNFTITESTPLDIEVAVDPEMLGKVFEELVTGRHETGSYYTPKPIVTFMSREAIKSYLRAAVPGEPMEAVEGFVERYDPAGLRDPEATLNALRDVRVCDPACGSGAYLLGMLHELLALRACLFATNQKLDPINAYQRKLAIIETNVYGVDIDPFAINIARLRLWLSLAVEFDGPNPPPLPNLDFKIECGDSLTAPPPRPPKDQGFRHDLLRKYTNAKTRYMTAHPVERLALKKEIAKLRDEIAAWTHAGNRVPGFDWPVEFAEVFAATGGFDILVMNPPYVATYSRQSEKKALRTELELREAYGAYGGRVNLFTCFVIRGSELAAANGVVVFIVPDTYATADSYMRVRQAYAERFRHHSWTLIRPPVFGASVRNVIVISGPGESALRAVVVEREEQLADLRSLHAAAQKTIWGTNHRVAFFSSLFEEALWATLSRNAAHMEDLFETRDGVNPGPRAVRERIVDPPGRSSHIRPLIEGRDIDPGGYRIHPTESLILYDRDAISPPERKAGASLRDPSVFLAPKVVSRQTADTLIAAIDTERSYVSLNSVHCTHALSGDVDDLWGLLGLLNSPLARLFYAIDGGETREVLPQVHISWLRDFPLPHDAHALLRRISPLAKVIYRKYDDRVVRGNGLQRVHVAVCEAYGLGTDKQMSVLEAYLRRYPRYAGDW